MMIIVQRVKEGLPGAEPVNISTPGTAQNAAASPQNYANPPVSPVQPIGNAPTIVPVVATPDLMPPTQEGTASYPQLVPANEQGTSSQFTEEQMEHARALQRNRSPRSDNPTSKMDEERQDNTKNQQYQTATEAPDVDDNEFFWYHTMTEQARQVGMRAIQTEFKPNQRFTNNKSDPDKLVLIQDVHVKFKRLLKANRFTESAAREILPCLYDGTAGRKFNSLRRKKHLPGQKKSWLQWRRHM